MLTAELAERRLQDAELIGKSAQLEVFNSQGIHLGEADLEGKIDLSKSDATKRLQTR